MKKIKGYDIQFDFSHFRRIADLIAFEGPLLSHYVSDKGDDYLFYWVESDENANRCVRSGSALPTYRNTSERNCRSAN